MDFPSEEIKAKLNIVDVVSGYIKLQRSGSSHKAVCPFHNENTPSFFVSEDKQIFNCFGCGKGGDIFKFIMEMEGVEFVDALRILAKQAGVELKRVDPKAQSERTTLQEICVDAARYFYKNLHSEVGKEALKYLEDRGLKKETMEEFRLGYCSSDWTGLYNFLTLKDYKPEMIAKAGLALISTKSGKNKYFDRFRDRIMFPISDVNGYIVGFTGRYLTEKENEGKYVNSPQTPVYDKSRILYGLEKSKMAIKKEGFTLLVEGQMDVISCWQDGIENVVASSGTALTPQQARLLKRYAPNVKMAFDMDSAGDSATKRGIDIASAEGLNISVVRIPEGKDPADFVLANAGKLKDVVEKAIPVMDYYFETALARHDKADVDGKKKISEEILPHIKNIQNKVQMYHWLEKLSGILGTDIKYIEEDMQNIKIDSYAHQYKKEESSDGKKNQPAGGEKKNDKTFVSLMAFLIKDPSQFSLLEEEKLFELKEEDKSGLDDVVSEELLLLFDFLKKHAKIGQISDILKEADEEQKELLTPIMLQAEIVDDTIKIPQEINFCLNKIKDDILRLKREKVHLKIKEAETAGDTEAVSERLEELNKI